MRGGSMLAAAIGAVWDAMRAVFGIERRIRQRKQEAITMIQGAKAAEARVLSDVYRQTGDAEAAAAAARRRRESRLVGAELSNRWMSGMFPAEPDGEGYPDRPPDGRFAGPR